MQNENPLVSVGLTCYNRPESLRRAIESVLNQTYKNLEIIISNDASPDPLVKPMLDEYAAKDSRIRIFHQPVDLTVGGNMMFVLGQATGKYFIYAQDDDTWSDGFITAMVSSLESHPESPVAACTTQYLDSAGDIIGTYYMDEVSPLKAICEVELSFIIMGLWRRDILKKFMVNPKEKYIGGDLIIVAEMLLAYDKKVQIIDSELYLRGIDHDKIKDWFREDRFCHLRSYYYLIKTLTFSKNISSKQKLWIPVIAVTNLVMVGKAYAAQIIFFLPRDHTIRIWARRMFK